MVEYKLNKISSEELTDKAMKLRSCFVKEINGLSIGEAVELMGIFNACVCNDIANVAKDTITNDDVLGAIYHLTAKSIKLHNEINKE